MPVNSVTGNTLLESGFFAPCRAATLAPITLSGLQTIDSVALIAGDRVLVWQQADATTNGIYAASSGNWVRTTDAASNTQFFDGMAVIVAQGTQGGTTFLCTCVDDPVIVGTSLLTFAAQQNVAQASQQATSSTSAALTTGAKTFATQAGKAFAAKQWVLIYETANPDNCLLAEITSYAAGSLAVNVASTGGSGGPYTDWTIVLTNSPAAAGRQPPIGNGNVTGPGSAIDGHAAVFDGTTGKLLKDSGIPLGTIAGRSQLQYGDAGAASIPGSALVPGAAPLAYCAPQPADNLHLANDGTNPTRDLSFSPGRCPADNDVTTLHLAATMLKRFDQAWAAGGFSGAPAGGCDTGTKGASQSWHLFLIASLGHVITAFSRTSNVATITVAGHGAGAGGSIRAFGMGSGVDALAAITAVTTNTISYANTGPDIALTSVTAVADLFDVLGSQTYATPTLPSGWTAKQCLGSFLTDTSGNIVAFVQFGDEFIYTTPMLDFTGAVPAASILIPLQVPHDVRVLAIMNVGMQVAALTGGSIILSATDQTNLPPGDAVTAAPLSTLIININSGGTYRLGGQARVWTNVSTQIRARSSAATISGAVSTIGYRDPRRRLF